MKPSIVLRVLSIIVLLFLRLSQALACSMYKITINGVTMVGNNEDSWQQTSRIWFEQGSEDKVGAVYVGYSNKSEPDGGMNEYGLAFDAFTMAYKTSTSPYDPSKSDFGYKQIRTVMQHCRNVEEAYAFFNKLNRHVLNGSILFNGGMLLFVDKAGHYLVVEGDALTLGYDDKFLLANFSLADTKDLSKVKVERYCKGVEFLQHHQLDSSLAFCRALSDTMSVSRAKIGDGTLYTNIYDLNQGIVHLYFFHDYSKCISFNLKEELAKGNHAYDFPTLFPNNSGYQKFCAFKTPQSTPLLYNFLLGTIGLLSLSALIFFISFIRLRRRVSVVGRPFEYFKLGHAALCIALGYYAYALIRNQGIFYFEAPYNDGHSTLLRIAAYLPVILLGISLPLFYTSFKIVKGQAWGRFNTALLMSNNVVFVVLLGLFYYWQLFAI